MSEADLHDDAYDSSPAKPHRSRRVRRRVHRLPGGVEHQLAHRGPRYRRAGNPARARKVSRPTSRTSASDRHHWPPYGQSLVPRVGLLVSLGGWPRPGRFRARAEADQLCEIFSAALKHFRDSTIKSDQEIEERDEECPRGDTSRQADPHAPRAEQRAVPPLRRHGRA